MAGNTLTVANSPLAARVQRPSARRRAAPPPACSHGKEKHQQESSGIHDPIGWGSGERLVKPQQSGREEANRLAAEHLAAEAQRSDSKGSHALGGSGVSRVGRDAAAQGQLAEVAEERREEEEEAAAEEEYAHMPRFEKWFFEAKAALYAWLKTGVEPL